MGRLFVHARAGCNTRAAAAPDARCTVGATQPQLQHWGQLVLMERLMLTRSRNNWAADARGQCSLLLVAPNIGALLIRIGDIIL